MATAWAHAPATPTATIADAPSSLRPEVILPLLVLATLYALGHRRLSRRAPHGVTRRRTAFAAVAVAALALALLSPLDTLAETRLSAHMVQHMLLIMVAAPALLLADPFPLVIWALPPLVRLHARPWIGRASAAGRLWRSLTAMRVAWIVSACVLWGWHLPLAYDAALSSRPLHDLEHLSFFAGALLFWWPVIHPAPRFRRAAPYSACVVYLVLNAFQTAALGLVLTLTPTVLYRAYATASRPGSLDPLDDQIWGGLVMWGLVGTIDMLAVLVLVYRTLGGGSSRSSSTATPRARTIS